MHKKYLILSLPWVTSEIVEKIWLRLNSWETTLQDIKSITLTLSHKPSNVFHNPDFLFQVYDLQEPSNTYIVNFIFIFGYFSAFKDTDKK